MMSAERYALGPLPSDRVLVATQPSGGALVTTATARALTCGIDALAIGTRELDCMVRNTAVGIEASWLQRASRTIARNRLVTRENFFGFPFVGALGGGAVGFCVSVAMNECWIPLFASLGTALGATVVPVGAGLLKAAKRQEYVAKERMIELADLRDPIARFRDAEGPAKVQIGLGLVQLRDGLDAHQVLAPEARAALNAAVAEVDALPTEVRDAARRLQTISQAIAGTIDEASVATIKAELETAPPDERFELATALRDLIFSDRKRVAHLAYTVRNRLYDVLDTSIASGGSETAI